MVLQKRLEYGFSGYQVPPIPRAARSARRRRSFESKTNGNQMYAFDLLATVAGKLLSEGESSSPSVDSFSLKGQLALVQDSVGRQEKSEEKLLEGKSGDQDFYERNFLFTDIVTDNPISDIRSDELEFAQNDSISKPNCPGKGDSAEHLVNDDCKLRLGIFTPANLESSGCRLSCNSGSDEECRKPRNFSVTNRADMLDSQHLTSGLVSSVDSVKFLICRDHSPSGSAPVNRENVKLAIIDDDESSPACTESSTRTKKFRPSLRVSNIHGQKLLSSKPCKATPNVKDHDRAVTERCNYLNRKRIIKHQRSLRDYPFKKRKFYDFVSNSDEGICCDRMCASPENGTNISALGSRPSLQREVLIWHVAFGSVKLKIKSFRVPELFIEVQETTTIGSLKKTVLEAVNAILGGGLRVGVLLQGKKIRDDTQTLLQTGISHDNKMDALGFTLEPNPHIAPSSQLCPDDHSCQLLHNNPRPVTRYPLSPNVPRTAIRDRNLDTPPDLSENNLNSLVESDHDSAPDSSLKIPGAQSKALVPVPSIERDALAVVPLRKCKRSDSSQRRIRRPFTVTEVEALVQAVEKLGTGRWRDVKLRAFDSAKHRTYVDLKDKWKTLVHTARISPQQRRGEPVPQELLDRVLTAHAYWSQQQAKQHLKSSSILTFFSENSRCTNP
ncbi:telomere repeat-binding protein 5 [Dorcoceras hygrometricum]|uniref:Telomere repeat-binding protein 5 n=1 Tax=Dorcoceras hygrometricum TaxID=472368 RepID=A0A2Z7BAH7_9LAMI|nr:telomere repeat-binding protein 5 [Dorcoceras hygrometricum]